MPSLASVAAATSSEQLPVQWSKLDKSQVFQSDQSQIEIDFAIKFNNNSTRKITTPLEETLQIDRLLLIPSNNQISKEHIINDYNIENSHEFNYFERDVLDEGTDGLQFQTEEEESNHYQSIQSVQSSIQHEAVINTNFLINSLKKSGAAFQAAK